MTAKRIPRDGERAAFLTLYIGKTRQRVHIRMKSKGITIGRNTKQESVDVDTVPFDGAKHGVSRRHVLIAPKKDYFFVRDLNSVNSTWHNKVRMSPMIAEELYHGDLLHLGELRIEVYYTYADELMDRLQDTNLLPALDDQPPLPQPSSTEYRTKKLNDDSSDN